MIAILALVDAEMAADIVVVLGDAGGELGFFASSVANFMRFAHPAAFRLVFSREVFFSHIFLL